MALMVAMAETLRFMSMSMKRTFFSLPIGLLKVDEGVRLVATANPEKADSAGKEEAASRGSAKSVMLHSGVLIHF